MLAQSIVSGLLTVAVPVSVLGPPVLPPVASPPASAETAPPPAVAAEPDAPADATIAEPPAPAPVAGPPTAAPQSTAPDLVPPGGAPVEPEATQDDSPSVATPPPPPPAGAFATRIGDPVAGPTVADPFAEPDSDDESLIARPVPRWKKVGLGVSAGFAVVSLTGALGTTISVARATAGRGPLANDIRAAAAADGAGTPIDPRRSISEICAMALMTDGSSNAVANARVGQECRRGERRAVIANGLWALTGLSVISTAVFTGLLFAKPKASRSQAALRRHRLQLAAAANQTSGTVRLTGRF